LDTVIYQINDQLDLLSSKADEADYFVAIASGIACSMLDILWCGDFDLSEGREIASEKIDDFVIKAAQLCDPDHKKPKDIHEAVKSLEDKFPVPNDANTPDFGGGLQHHLRDFGHHPTIVGLMFSILTQFTRCSYGTDTNGKFCVKKVPANAQNLIGETVPQKIINGTIIWFFHLVSDMAGSSNTAGYSGGTGIPGPILSLAKELSTLPIIRDISIDETTLSEFLSKMFNGTLWAKRDERGKIIKDTVVRLDLRGELGVGIELAKISIPVVANECIVRGFYFLRHFAMELRIHKVRSLEDICSINIYNALPINNNPTLSRMLTISTGVFTTVNIGNAVLEKKLVAVNLIGVGRFAVAIGKDVSWGLKRRNLEKLKDMYETIDQNVFRQREKDLYMKTMATQGFGLTLEQTEILYNIEYYKILNDINNTKEQTKQDSAMAKKKEWLQEWKNFITINFANFIQVEHAKMHWYSMGELMTAIEENHPDQPWLRMVLLEAMLFEPYFPFKEEEDRKGNRVPEKNYDVLKTPGGSFDIKNGDQYLDVTFAGIYCEAGLVKQLRKDFNKYTRDLNGTSKNALKAASVATLITVATAALAGAFAPAIATALVGSNFVGLGGVALTNASLAYLGGGALAVGGTGMAGGTMTIVGGGAALGIGVGGSLGGVAGMSGIVRKNDALLQSTKLLVSLEDILLKDEKSIEYIQDICEQYRANLEECEFENIKMKLDGEISSEQEKKE